MKAYTDIEQSKKLAEILPFDTADMWWPYYYDVVSDTGEYTKEPLLHKPVCDPDKALPCWSFAALLNVLPETIDDEWDEYELEIDIRYKRPKYVTLGDSYHPDFPVWDFDNEELLDNIVEAIIWLNNNDYLQK